MALLAQVGRQGLTADRIVLDDEHVVVGAHGGVEGRRRDGGQAAAASRLHPFTISYTPFTDIANVIHVAGP